MRTASLALLAIACGATPSRRPASEAPPPQPRDPPRADPPRADEPAAKTVHDPATITDLEIWVEDLATPSPDCGRVPPIHVALALDGTPLGTVTVTCSTRQQYRPHVFEAPTTRVPPGEHRLTVRIDGGAPTERVYSFPHWEPVDPDLPDSMRGTGLANRILVMLLPDREGVQLQDLLPPSIRF